VRGEGSESEEFEVFSRSERKKWGVGGAGDFRALSDQAIGRGHIIEKKDDREMRFSHYRGK